MKSKRPPDPEYLVICSDKVDWQSQAETVARFGRPMLLYGSCDGDLEFVHRLMEKYGLEADIDVSKKKYLLWSPAGTSRQKFDLYSKTGSAADSRDYGTTG